MIIVQADLSKEQSQAVKTSVWILKARTGKKSLTEIFCHDANSNEQAFAELAAEQGKG